ncbi:MAG TPA: hypothetical protein VHY56_02010, partial [Candidatus Binataceae bacterium]|nr:hypothetical protein [Candidatus Binataceae bacterium]
RRKAQLRGRPRVAPASFRLIFSNRTIALLTAPAQKLPLDESGAMLNGRVALRRELPFCTAVTF